MKIENPESLNNDSVRRMATILSEVDRLLNGGNIDSAIEVLCEFLKEYPSVANSYIAWFKLGLMLTQARHYERSIAAYQAALEQKPDLFEARVNLGLILEKLARPQEALAVWCATSVSPEGQTLLLNQQGRLLETLFVYDEAEKRLLQSLLINPEQRDALQHFTHLRAKQCKWPVIVDLPGLSPELQEGALGPLGVLAYKDDPQLQYQTIVSWVQAKFSDMPIAISPKKGYSHKKLRLGYMSSDFRWHAVSILAVELFELHDKEKFETYAFDFSPEDGSDFRKRVLAAFDHHIPMHTLSDQDAAQIIRDNEIDVLIDLNGLTANARPGILRFKPAPVQATWLGSLTTTGIKEVDYVITDPFVFHKSLEKYFVEQPAYLPTTFQLNDSKRVVGATLEREAYGLPPDKFVYACLNNNYKITPEVFAIWMRILRRTPNSIVWLLADNQWSKSSLLKQAKAHGIDADRVVFAQRVLPADYLARFKAADLFLDTSPYNAGTTAIDALWVGLPVLTCPGECFSSRVAGSILNAAGLPELVVKNWQEYEDLAVAIAQDPKKLTKLKSKLLAIKKSPLFDTKSRVRELEKLIYSIAVRAD
jgi:predicted O-linked N-acetylglucosamine transferase (SPINDLY family)